jgi:hypothetical protein
MARSEFVRTRVSGMQPVQVLTALVSLVVLAAGIYGYTKTGVTGDKRVFLHGFAANPLHDFVNCAVGVIGLLMALGSGRARTFGWLLLAGFGLLFVWGLMLTGTLTTNVVSTWGNPLELNTPDNWLNLGIAGAGLLIALMPARRQAAVEVDESLLAEEDRVGHRHHRMGHGRVDPT